MRLWTDGTITMLLCGKGVIRWHRGEEPVVVRPLAPQMYVADDERDGMLVVTPNGIDQTEELRAHGAVDAAFLDEERVAAIVERDEQYVLALGDPSGRWTHQIPLHDIEATNVAWPKGLIYAQHGDAVFDDEVPPRGIPFGTPPRLTVNRWGIAVSSDSSGVAVLFRPGRDVVELAMRFPWGASKVDAVATELGMLVTYVIQARETALFHLAASGDVIATRRSHGSPPALLVDGGVLLLDEQKQHVEVLDDRLDPIARKSVGAQRGDSAVSLDGKAFAFADDAVISVGRIAGSKLSKLETVEYASAIREQKRRREVRASGARYDGKRAGGAAAIGFAVGRAQSAWRAVAGTSFELTVSCRSVGGAGRGIRIAVTGPALQRVAMERVEIHDHSMPFTLMPDGSYVADCDDVELVEGIVYPFDPKPKSDIQTRAAAHALDTSQFDVRVHGRALEASSDLIGISVGAMRSSAAPVRWMRPLTIEAP